MESKRFQVTLHPTREPLLYEALAQVEGKNAIRRFVALANAGLALEVAFRGKMQDMLGDSSMVAQAIINGTEPEIKSRRKRSKAVEVVPDTPSLNDMGGLFEM